MKQMPAMHFWTLPMLSHLLIDKVILSTTHKSSYTGPFYPAAMLNGIHIRRELFD